MGELEARFRKIMVSRCVVLFGVFVTAMLYL